MKKSLIAIVFLLCIALQCAAKRNDLSGCIFRTYDFHVVQLFFYDSKHCECRQWFTLPLPRDNGERVDTLLYRTKGYKLILENPRVSKNDSWVAGEKCIDYLSLSFKESNSIIRDGKELEEYKINAVRVPWGSPIYRGFWYQWPRQSIGIFELPDFLSIANYEFFQIEGSRERAYFRENEPQYPEWRCQFDRLAFPCDEMQTKGTWGFLWFSREKAENDSDSTKVAILGKRFVCAPDTLAFISDSVCTIHHTTAFIGDSESTIHQATTRSFRYQVDGANVLIYGWNALMPEKSDTLVYQDYVLYHSCVTQFSNVMQPVVPQPGTIDSGTAIKHLPTAKMETRAFVRNDVIVSDEQIGTTFLQIYTPMNFHSLVHEDK